MLLLVNFWGVGTSWIFLIDGQLRGSPRQVDLKESLMWVCAWRFGAKGIVSKWLSPAPFSVLYLFLKDIYVLPHWHILIFGLTFDLCCHLFWLPP
jgi:hypothetical protein